MVVNWVAGVFGGWCYADSAWYVMLVVFYVYCMLLLRDFHYSEIRLGLYTNKF